MGKLTKRLNEKLKDLQHRRFGIWMGRHPRNAHGEGATQIVTPEKYRENKLVRDFYGKKIMPCCGSKEYREGPCGGMSMNIICPECGKKYNICEPIGTIEEI